MTVYIPLDIIAPLETLGVIALLIIAFGTRVPRPHHRPAHRH